LLTETTGRLLTADDSGLGAGVSYAGGATETGTVAGIVGMLGGASVAGGAGFPGDVSTGLGAGVS
jgi:hypothetical protein